MEKQDLNGVRTPSDLERKYQFSLLKKAIELIEKGLTKIQGELYDFVDATTKHFKSVDGKLDGYYSIWFFAGVPTLENAPASEWDDFSIHLDDLYYDTDTGYSYRFILENDEYKWIKLDDDDLSNVLAIASHAQDTADSKRRVFVEEPVPPYDVGDLWITKGQIFACEQSRTVDDAAADPANDFGLTLDYASNGRVDGVQDVTDSIETLFTIDRKNGTIRLQAGKLLEILSGGTFVVDAENYKLNADGTVTITGGKIGGFAIDGNNIKRVDSDGNLFELTGGQAPGVYYSSENGKQYGYFGWHTGAGALTGGLEFTLVDDSGSTTKVSLNESFMQFLNKTASNNQMFVRYGLDGIQTFGKGLTVDDKPVACQTKDDVNEMVNLLGTGTDTPVDDDYFISQYVGGGEITKTYHRRKFSKLWAYIKSKADLVYESVITTLPISKGGTGETNRLESLSLSSVKGTGSYGLRYYPYLKMCFLRMQVTGVEISQGTTTTVGVVPSGYRPSYINALSVYYSGYGTIVKAQINSSGQIRILSSAALGTSAGVYITGWWIVS